MNKLLNCQYVLFLQTSIIQSTKHQTRVNGRISCLASAEKIWQIFHGRNPHTQLCCSSHKCMFLTNVAPFKREINRLSNGIRFIAKKLRYNKEIIYQTHISSLFMLSLYEEYEGVITKKGKSAAINKLKEMAWSNTADRLNVHYTSLFVWVVVA